MAMYEKEGDNPQNIISFILSEREYHSIINALIKLKYDTRNALKLANLIRQLFLEPHHNLSLYFNLVKRDERKFLVTNVEDVFQIPGIMVSVVEGEYKLSEDCLNLRVKQDEEYIVGITDDGIVVHCYVFQKGWENVFVTSKRDSVFCPFYDTNL